MSDFELEAWEVGPRCKEKTAGRSQREYLGKKWRAVEMRHKKFVVFVRDVRAEHQGNWMIAAMEGNQPRVWSPRPDIATSPPNINVDHGMGRFFVWGDEMMFLLSNGDGVWLDAQLRAEVPFRSSVPQGIVENSSRETFEWLTRELGEDSDVALARRWRTFDDEEKMAVLFGGQNHLDATRELMSAVLVSDENLWHTDRISRWRISQNDLWGKLFLSEERQHRGWSTFMVDWAETIVSLCITPRIAVPIQSHPCVFQFSQTNDNYVEVEVSGPPTQHERLEARLRLREWLEQNAPDKLEELLP